MMMCRECVEMSKRGTLLRATAGWWQVVESFFCLSLFDPDPCARREIIVVPTVTYARGAKTVEAAAVEQQRVPANKVALRHGIRQRRIGASSATGKRL